MPWYSAIIDLLFINNIVPASALNGSETHEAYVISHKIMGV